VKYKLLFFYVVNEVAAQAAGMRSSSATANISLGRVSIPPPHRSGRCRRRRSSSHEFVGDGTTAVIVRNLTPLAATSVGVYVGRLRRELLVLLLFLASLYRTQTLAHAMAVSVGTTAVVPAEPATTSIASSSAQQTAVASFVSGIIGLELGHALLGAVESRAHSRIGIRFSELGIFSDFSVGFQDYSAQFIAKRNYFNRFGRINGTDRGE
jgi:hypothetical protein